MASEEIIADTPSIDTEGGRLVAVGDGVDIAAGHIMSMPGLSAAAAADGQGLFRSTWGSGVELLARATRLLGLAARTGAADLQHIDEALAVQAMTAGAP